jgi:hypothetical protein
MGAAPTPPETVIAKKFQGMVALLFLLAQLGPRSRQAVPPFRQTGRKVCALESLPQPGEKRNDALGVFEGEFALVQRGAVAWVGLPGGDNRFAQPDGEAGRPAGGQPPTIQPKSLKY